MSNKPQFDDLEVVPEAIQLERKKILSEAKEELRPKYGSPEWNDYVLNLLTEDEKQNGNPTCNGLRRVAEELLGEMLYSKPVQIFPSSSENGVGRATVVYEICFLWKADVPEYLNLNKFEYPEKIFGDVGEAWAGNTPHPFSKHATATACSRAEARTLRKALKLKVVSAEELGVVEEQEDGSTAFQRSTIKTKCKNLNIDVDKLVTNIEKISHKDAVTILGTLDKYSSNVSEIPQEIKL